jgi:hypothetical protein
MLDKELKRITSEKINTCKKYRKTTEWIKEDNPWYEWDQ